MNFEDVGRVWREQGTGDFQRRKIENLSTVRGRAEKLLGGIHKRGTYLTILTFVLVVPMFTMGIVNSPRPWMATMGVAILWLWLALLLRLVRSLGAPRTVSPLPVRAAVESEVARLRRLERFWDRVHWGFLVFLVGEILAFEGFRPLDSVRGTQTVLFYVALLAIVIVGTVGRRRDARLKVRPLREELEGWLAGLEAFDFDRELDAGR